MLYIQILPCYNSLTLSIRTEISSVMNYFVTGTGEEIDARAKCYGQENNVSGKED